MCSYRLWTFHRQRLLCCKSSALLNSGHSAQFIAMKRSKVTFSSNISLFLTPCSTPHLHDITSKAVLKRNTELFERSAFDSMIPLDQTASNPQWGWKPIGSIITFMDMKRYQSLNCFQGTINPLSKPSSIHLLVDDVFLGQDQLTVRWKQTEILHSYYSPPTADAMDDHVNICVKLANEKDQSGYLIAPYSLLILYLKR